MREPPEAERARTPSPRPSRRSGSQPRFQEFHLLGYEADEPELEVEGEPWTPGPCMYAHSFAGEGTVRRIGASPSPIGDATLPNFAVVDATGARLRAY